MTIHCRQFVADSTWPAAKEMVLTPVLTQMVLWVAAHEDTSNQALVRLIKKDNAQFLANVRKRWLSQTASGKAKHEECLV